jgi:hypothetical protein
MKNSKSPSSFAKNAKEGWGTHKCPCQFLQRKGPSQGWGRRLACAISPIAAKLWVGVIWLLKFRSQQRILLFRSFSPHSIFRPCIASGNRSHSRLWLSCSCRNPSSTCPRRPSCKTSHPWHRSTRRHPYGHSTMPSPWHHSCDHRGEHSMRVCLLHQPMPFFRNTHTLPYLARCFAVGWWGCFGLWFAPRKRPSRSVSKPGFCTS